MGQLKSLLGTDENGVAQVVLIFFQKLTQGGWEMYRRLAAAETLPSSSMANR